MGEGNRRCEKYASRSKIYLDVSFAIDWNKRVEAVKKKNDNDNNNNDK